MGELLRAARCDTARVAPVTTVLWVVDVLGRSVIGVTLVGDTVRVGWAPWVACAVLVMVAASAVLVVEAGGTTGWVA